MGDPPGGGRVVRQEQAQGILVAALGVLAAHGGYGEPGPANCEFKDLLRELREQRGIEMHHAYRSEREDWIQTMVMAGIRICFLPEFSVLLPGLQTRPLIDPEVTREVSLVTVAGRRFSPAVAAFVREIKAYQWPA